MYIESISKLSDYVGKEIGVSEWFEISQDRIDQFAIATDDHQWIHVDPVRSSVESPYQTTVAHGFLTLSMLSAMGHQALKVGGVSLMLNYGFNRVRFILPVRAGALIRSRLKLLEYKEIKGGAQITLNVEIECDGNNNGPCCVAEWIARYYE